MENEVMNILVKLINLAINYGEAKAIVRHLLKAFQLYLYDQLYNKIKRESVN
jgi:hypothetical protein